MQVIDFSKIHTGTLVTRSDHYKKEFCIKSKKKEIGILTGVHFFEEKRNGKLIGIITWPLIFWENGLFGRLTHPALVVLYRKQKCPPNMIELDAELK